MFRTTPLELPMCTTSKQMAFANLLQKTSSSSQVPPTYLPKMTPSRARPPESSAAHSVGCDDTGFTLVTRRKKKKDTTHPPLLAPDLSLNKAPTTTQAGSPQPKGKTIAIDTVLTIPMLHDPSASTSVVHNLLPTSPILPTATQATSPQPKASSPQPKKHTDHAPVPPSTVPLPTDSSLPPIDSTQPSPTKHLSLPNDFHSSAQPNFEPFHNNAASVAPSISQLQLLDTTNCMESKMASLQSHSDASSAVDGLAETSTACIPPCDSHDDSPIPSPKTVRKKKGGRKRKEVKGL
ncbi:hypothetical protein D5086_027666 [Populus alba]|uniref:Uncharacterized protein n=1 Tax=Populus alba TaxID=43335 RepID=A0ACC4AW19_POPAL